VSFVASIIFYASLYAAIIILNISRTDRKKKIEKQTMRF